MYGFPSAPLFFAHNIFSFVFKAHFLKVPSLPFYSLVGILAKFPADVDSRVFWSSGVRDTLYGSCPFFLFLPVLQCYSSPFFLLLVDVTFAAIQVLQNRIEEQSKRLGPAPAAEDVQYTNELLEDLIRMGSECKGWFLPLYTCIAIRI
jgi:hypothetical protein